LKNALSATQFKSIFTGSKSLRAGDLLFRFKVDRNPLLGLIVSRMYGNAVQRNLFKRRCRAIFSDLKGHKFPYSLIITPRQKNLNWTDISLAFSLFKRKLSD